MPLPSIGGAVAKIAVPAALKSIPWKLIGVCAAAVAFALLYAALQAEKRHSAKLQARVTILTATLDDLAAKSKAAQERAEIARQAAKREADKLRSQAERIEAPRPLSGRCETPAEIRELDL